MPAGRPSSFSSDKVEAICERLMVGESLRAICRDKDMPGISTVMAWLNKSPEFQEQYVRAREIQAEYLVDEIIEIADKAGEEKVNSARLRIDARKWAASKMAPKKYADRQIIAGDDNAPLRVEHTKKLDISGLTDLELDALEGALEKTLMLIEHEPSSEIDQSE